MQAVVKVAAEPGAVEVQDLPQPGLKPGEALLRVAAASICGSDIHFYNWDKVSQGFFKPPMTMGHEFSGTVVEVAGDVQNVKAGDHVIAESVEYCGVCAPCRRGSTHLCINRQLFGIHRPGGMAEFVAAPARLLHRLPDAVPVQHAAVVEPSVVSLHAALLQPPRPGDVVLVTGPGPVGLLAGQVARSAGAEVFIAGTPGDVEVRMPIAQQLGLRPLDPSVSPAEGLRQASGGLADLVIECSGSGKALANAVEASRPGGQITLVGLFGSPVEVDISAAIRKELSLRTSYIGTWHDFERVITMLADGSLQVSPLLRPYKLSEALTGFADAMGQRVMKPLLVP